MGYADDGDIQKKVEDQKKMKDDEGISQFWTEDQVLDWFFQIVLAVKHCHDRRILHRDIKSANILLTKDGKAQLADFGISRVLSRTKSLANSGVGTPLYFSPEITNGEAYNYKSDIWSLGVLLYEMCALEPPF